MFKKVFSGLLLLLVLSAVFFLALQGPKETTDLSNRVWQAAQRIGYTGTPQQIRSDIHLVVYFMVGLAAIFFCRAMGWKPWIGLIAACIIGLLEETLKICLPTREFSWIDTAKDCIGAGIAFLIYSVVCILHKKSPITNTNVTVDEKIKTRFTANEIMKQSGAGKEDIYNAKIEKIDGVGLFHSTE